MTDAEKDMFCQLLSKLQFEIHDTARSHGWWDNPNPNFGEKISLMHSELSEALEAMRHGNQASEHIPEFSGVQEEFADTLVRMLDTMAWLEEDLGEAFFAKMEFNKTRPHKHGGKIF